MNGFDRLAPVYDLLSGVASAGRIHASQVELLPRLPRCPRALVVGGGTGRFLVALLETGLVDRVVSLDASAGMNRRAAARLGALAPRVQLRTGGIECLGPLERFDLVVTHCFLDLFEPAECAAVVGRLRRALAPGGHWLWSDFSDHGDGLPGLARRSIVAGLYAFFRAACGITASRLPDAESVFSGSGLECVERASLAGGLLKAALYSLPTPSASATRLM